MAEYPGPLDKPGEPDHHASLLAERDQLRQQVEGLLGAVDAHRNRLTFGRDRDLYAAADQVRKELGDG